MKCTLNLDKDNYILSVAFTNHDSYIIDMSTIELAYINAYKLVDGELVLDEVKKQSIINERTKKSTEQQILILKQELAQYDYIGTKLAMGVATKEEYAEQIAYTETIREQIRQLETFRTESEQPKEV